MDLYALRLDQPYPGARHRDPDDGRGRHLPYPPCTRAGRAPGAVAGAAAGEGEGGLMLLSTSCSRSGRPELVRLAIAEHGPAHVDPPARQGNQRLVDPL